MLFNRRKNAALSSFFTNCPTDAHRFFTKGQSLESSIYMTDKWVNPAILNKMFGSKSTCTPSNLLNFVVKRIFSRE